MFKLMDKKIITILHIFFGFTGPMVNRPIISSFSVTVDNIGEKGNEIHFILSRTFV